MPQSHYIRPYKTTLARNRCTALAVCAFLPLAVILAFGQTLRHQFVNLDDDLYVYNNPDVNHGLTAQAVAWAFTATHAHNWHPLTWLSHALDCQLFGLDVWGHHLSNILLHALNAILLFLLFWRMTGKLWHCAFVAAVFAIHPLRVESVAWVAERKDVLCGLFFMLTLMAYVGYVRRSFSLVRYLTVVLLYALGLMAKPMLVTLPFVLLLLDYWPLRRFQTHFSSRTTWLLVEKVPLLALAAASCVATSIAQRAAIVAFDAIPTSERIANALVAYVAYLRQLVYPAGLAVFYPYSKIGLFSWQAAGAIIILGVISAAALLWRRRRPWLLVGWCWYLGTLVPVIGAVQVGTQSMADRYTYLTQIGIYLALTWGAVHAVSAWSHRRALCSVAATLLTICLMGCAWRQTTYWRDSESLWLRDLSCASPSCLALNNYGNVLNLRGQSDEAIAQYQKTLQLNPRDSMVYNNLGVAFADRGEFDKAIAHYQKALELRPDYAEAHNNLGAALANSGRSDEAFEQYRRALEIQPKFAEAHNNYANILSSRGQADEAILHYLQALEIKPNFAEAHENLGKIYAHRGQFDKVIVHARQALEIKPNFDQAHFSLGRALSRLGQLDEAIVHYRRALEIKPNNAKTHNELGYALAGRGQFDEAIAHFQKALELHSDYAEAANNLGLALARRGQMGEAIVYFQRAIEIQPDSADAYNNLAWLRATCPQQSFRNGPEAVELARRAMGISAAEEPGYLDTLAAAYAEAGQFSRAVETATRAIMLATARGNTVLADGLQARIKLYRAGAPYHETSGPPR